MKHSGTAIHGQGLRTSWGVQISVVIPVRDRRTSVLLCLESLLEQSHQPIEVIVVDDGSAIPIADMWMHRKTNVSICFLRQVPKGIAAARNRGVAECSGDLVLFTDSDCIFNSVALEQLAACASKHPDDVAFQLAFTATSGRLVWRVDDLSLRAKQAVLLNHDGHIRFVATGGFAVRRSLIDSSGDLFCESDIRGSDTSLLATLASGGMLPLFVPRSRVQHRPCYSLPRYLLRHFSMGYHTEPARSKLRSSTDFLMTLAKRIMVLRVAWRLAHDDCRGRFAFVLLILAHSIEVCGRLVRKASGTPKGQVAILGVQVDCLRQAELRSAIVKAARSRTGACFTYLTAWSLVQAKRNPAFKQALGMCTTRYADGMGVVLAVLVLGHCRTDKVTANDFFMPLCEELTRSGLSVGLIGSSPSVIETVRRKLERSMPSLRVVVSASGYLTDVEEQSVIRDICRSRPHLIVLAMGQPKQEQFALRLGASYTETAFLCVGGLFDCIAGVNPTPPRAIRRYGFEWLYRLCHSPRRTWRRYLLGLPMFAYDMILEVLSRVCVKPLIETVRTRACKRQGGQPRRG